MDHTQTSEPFLKKTEYTEIVVCCLTCVPVISVGGVVYGNMLSKMTAFADSAHTLYPCASTWQVCGGDTWHGWHDCSDPAMNIRMRHKPKEAVVLVGTCISLHNARTGSAHSSAL